MHEPPTSGAHIDASSGPRPDPDVRRDEDGWTGRARFGRTFVDAPDDRRTIAGARHDRALRQRFPEDDMRLPALTLAAGLTILAGCSSNEVLRGPVDVTPDEYEGLRRLILDRPN